MESGDLSLPFQKLNALMSEEQFREDRDWPHAPAHRLGSDGVYIVTAGTLYKEHFFKTPESLNLLESRLLSLARQYQWQLEAWAVFSNHYLMLRSQWLRLELAKLFISCS